MAHLIHSLIKLIFVFGISSNVGISAKTCPGFPGYCSESFPGQTCIVVCSRGRPNVPLCQEDGTWTDIPRCVEHDPGVVEQIPGLCPGISGYCSEGFVGNSCKFTCSFGPNIDSICTEDGTWTPYPTCQGDLRETQDGCDGCPGPNGRPRNRTAEAILGITSQRPAQAPTNDRRIRPTFAGNLPFGPIAKTERPQASNSFIPPQAGNNDNFVPNLADAGLRTATSSQRPSSFFPTQAPQVNIPQTQRPLFQQVTTQRPFQQPQFANFPQQPQQQPFGRQQPQSGFSKEQLDIINGAVNRLNQFGQFGGQQQPQPQQPVQDISQFNRQQQPQPVANPINRARQPVQQPQPQRPPQPRPQPQPQRPPQPQPQPQPQTTPRTQSSNDLSPLQLAILKNAGVTSIPKEIPKVESDDSSEPHPVQFLFEDGPTNRGQSQDGRFFGPFEVVDPRNPVLLGGGEPDLRTFPAIPDDQPFAQPPPVPGSPRPQFGPFQVVDL